MGVLAPHDRAFSLEPFFADIFGPGASVGLYNREKGLEKAKKPKKKLSGLCGPAVRRRRVPGQQPAQAFAERYPCVCVTTCTLNGEKQKARPTGANPKGTLPPQKSKKTPNVEPEPTAEAKRGLQDHLYWV